MSNPNQTDVRSSARDAIEQDSEDATWDDVMYRIYVRQKIEAGLRDVENGDTLTTQEIRKRFGLPNERLIGPVRLLLILSRFIPILRLTRRTMPLPSSID